MARSGASSTRAPALTVQLVIRFRSRSPTPLLAVAATGEERGGADPAVAIVRRHCRSGIVPSEKHRRPLALAWGVSRTQRARRWLAGEQGRGARYIRHAKGRRAAAAAYVPTGRVGPQRRAWYRGHGSQKGVGGVMGAGGWQGLHPLLCCTGERKVAGDRGTALRYTGMCGLCTSFRF